MVKKLSILALSFTLLLSSPVMLLATEGQSLKSRIEEGKAYVKSSVQTRIENRTDTRKIIEERENRFESISDEKKRVIVERIEENLEKMNKNAIEHFERIIVRLEKIVEKLKERGANTLDAEEKIEEAKTAIEAQSAKTYEITIDDEENLGQEVSGVVKSLRTDLKVVKEKVKDAKEAVKDVFETIREEKEDEKN